MHGRWHGEHSSTLAASSGSLTLRNLYFCGPDTARNGRDTAQRRHPKICPTVIIDRQERGKSASWNAHRTRGLNSPMRTSARRRPPVKPRCCLYFHRMPEARRVSLLHSSGTALRQRGLDDRGRWPDYSRYWFRKAQLPILGLRIRPWHLVFILRAKVSSRKRTVERRANIAVPLSACC